MELNKKETPAEDYKFQDEKYNCHYTKSVYYPIWEKCLELLKDKKIVLEIGCGVGQFANMLLDRIDINYIGFDFSEYAILNALNLNAAKLSHPYRPDNNCYFYIEDALLSDLYTKKDYDVYILLEVLEHIKRDKLILAKIPKDKYILFSLPDFDCDNHIRLFKSKQEIIERYKYLVTIKNIFKFKLAGHIFWLCEGIKK